MPRDDLPIPAEGILLTHFVVAADVARSAAFYRDILGGTVVREGEPSMVRLANSWVIINVGGGPTEDKPDVSWRLRPTRTGPARSSTSGWPTLGPCTPSGAPVAGSS